VEGEFMIPFKIDGQPVEGREGGNVLEVAMDAGIDIPHLCYQGKVEDDHLLYLPRDGRH
jgi:NADH dehydrogenase/NADH:ubiquinone oxidoreductase subunit G